MAGKGDKIRKGANLNLYWENYDRIFRKNEDDNPQKTKESLLNELDKTSYSELQKKLIYEK